MRLARVGLWLLGIWALRQFASNAQNELDAVILERVCGCWGFWGLGGQCQTESIPEPQVGAAGLRTAATRDSMVVPCQHLEPYYPGKRSGKWVDSKHEQPLVILVTPSS